MPETVRVGGTLRGRAGWCILTCSRRWSWDIFLWDIHTRTSTRCFQDFRWHCKVGRCGVRVCRTVVEGCAVAGLNIFTVEQLISALNTKYGNAAIRKAMEEDGASEEEILKMSRPKVTELKHVSKGIARSRRILWQNSTVCVLLPIHPVILQVIDMKSFLGPHIEKGLEQFQVRIV